MIAWPRRRPILYFVTDRTRLPSHSVTHLLSVIRAATQAGIDAIQIRERDLSDRILIGLLREALAITRSARVPLLVNDRVDIALAGGAAGVHLREDSVAVDRVRTMVPPGFTIGRSVHSLAAAEMAARAGCDYVLFGTIFRSASKPAGHSTVGTSPLAEMCRRIEVPVLAIGGIDESNASHIGGAGAAGIAAVGAFQTDDESALAARLAAIRDAFDRGSRLV